MVQCKLSPITFEWNTLWYNARYTPIYHISSKFDYCIGVDMVMCHVLICVKEIHQLLTNVNGRSRL